MTGKQLIEKAKSGEKLKKPQRLAAIRYLLEKRDMTNRELADIFNVSGRTIARDRKEIREGISEELLNGFGLAGSLYLEYRRAMRELNDILNEAQDPGEKRRSIKDRWKIAFDFYEVIKDREIEKRIETLEEKVGINEN